MPTELRNYYATPRERTEQFLLDLLAGDKRPSAVQASQVRNIMGALDFTPAGVLFGAYDVGNMIGAGIANSDPWKIARGVGLGALAALPLPVVRKVLKDRMARASRRFEFDPPQELPRPFNLKNARATPGVAQGRATRDIEGGSLTARSGVGPNAVGGPGEALPAFTTQGTWRFYPRAQLRTNADDYAQRTPPQVNGQLTEGFEQGPITRASQFGLHDPPRVRQRPFRHDYRGLPEVIPAHDQGRLLEDIEGRPLVAKYVVGRNMLGAPDEAFPIAEFDALAEATIGRPAEGVSQAVLGPAAGRTYLKNGKPVLIHLRSDLGEDWDRVYGHELGHVIDQLGGQLSIKKLEGEAELIYNAALNPARNLDGSVNEYAVRVTPESFGYEGKQVAREYMAEAIRAYLYNPNYMKYIAPKLAAAIRAAVNSNPKLNKIIQFNAMAPVAATGLSSPEGETPDSEEPAGHARVDPSDPRVSDRLSPEEWMELRNSRNEGEETGRVRLNLRDLPPSDGLSTPEWMKRRRKQLGKP